MRSVPPIKEVSSGYGRLVDLALIFSWGVVLREDFGVGSCDIVAVGRDGGFALLAAFTARRVLQSRSVLAKRGDSAAGVHGDGEGGRDVEADPGLEPATLPSRDRSAVIPGECDVE